MMEFIYNCMSGRHTEYRLQAKEYQKKSKTGRRQVV